MIEFDQRVNNRINTYIDSFLLLLKRIDPLDKYGLDLNMHQVISTAKEYFIQSDFIKTKHNIKYTNASKRMSLTISCIMKNKPIYISKEVDDLPAKILLINEIYAIILGITHLSYRKCFSNKEAFNNFLYLLYNKCIDPEAFAITIDIFSKVLKECKEINNAS